MSFPPPNSSDPPPPLPPSPNPPPSLAPHHSTPSSSSSSSSSDQCLRRQTMQACRSKTCVVTPIAKADKRKDLDHKKKKRKSGESCQGCCRCAAGFTVDCAAVCCCPLALLHLAAMAFIRLPTAVAWKMAKKMKNRLPCVRRRECSAQRQKTKAGEDDDGGRGTDAEICSPSSSPYPGIASATPPGYGVRIVRFDSDKLLQHFHTEDLDFGGFCPKP